MEGNRNIFVQFAKHLCENDWLQKIVKKMMLKETNSYTCKITSLFLQTFEITLN